MRRGTSWLPNESDGLPFRYAPGQPAAHVLLVGSVLRRMTPELRLAKAFELGEMGRELLRAGLRLRHPGATEEEIRALELQEVVRCHNRNY